MIDETRLLFQTVTDGSVRPVHLYLDYSSAFSAVAAAPAAAAAAAVAH